MSRDGRNIEIKARVAAPEALRRRVEALADEGPDRLDQHDVFFRCPNGRLKLRRMTGRGPELIHYQRDDREGTSSSRYSRVPCEDADGLEAALRAAYGRLGEVRKRRDLYLLGRTRVHLDQVEGLGSFVELEVVLASDEDPEDGHVEAKALCDRLGIADSDRVAKAYMDLLLTHAAGAPSARP